MAQTLWAENEKQFSGGTDVGAKISKRKLEKKQKERRKKWNGEEKLLFVSKYLFLTALAS